MVELESKPKGKFSFRQSKIIVVVVIFFVLAGIAGWSSYSYFQAQKKITELSTVQGQQMLAQKEVDMLLAQVRKHMVLPGKEKPTVATITDIQELKKNQPFFNNAQNGDKVIVYVGEKKAIVYSPQRDLIVNVGFIAVDGDGTSQNAEENSQKRLTVEVRNGTETSGLARVVSNKLSGNKSFQVSGVTDASKKDYSQTIIIDLGKSRNQDVITTLAKLLNAQIVKTLPTGEKIITSEVLVIVGTDQSSQ